MSVRRIGILLLIPIVVKSLGINSDYVGTEMIRFHPAVLVATIVLVGFTIFLANQKPTKWQKISHQ